MRFRAAILASSLAGLSFLDSAQGSVEILMRHAASALQRDGAAGVSMVAVVHGHIHYLNAGSSNRAGLPVTENTLFETASVSKVFTTTLLGIDVARGSKSLNDRITKFLHRKVPLRLRKATLGMLATYTAGFPNLPPEIRDLPTEDWALDSYSVDDFLNFVSRLRPRTPLPAHRVYSDASVGFLALCLGHLRLETWEARLEQEIFRPLGMHDTALQLDPSQESRLAQGEATDGSFTPRWQIDPFAASDGVKSTAHDLGNFLAAQLEERPGVPAKITEGMEIAAKPRLPVTHTILQALAWTWLPGEVHGKPVWIIMKGGNLTGFSSRICYSPDLGIGVAILANRGNLPTLEVAQNLLQQIAEDEEPRSVLSLETFP